MTEELKDKLLDILIHFKTGLDDIEESSGERQPMQDEIDFALPLVKKLVVADVSNRFDSKYTPPFRVGRKQGKAVLDANGVDVVFFSNSEEQAKKYCDYLNGC